jgi:uncharacterized repeat protein (TIGR01451 family)
MRFVQAKNHSFSVLTLPLLSAQSFNIERYEYGQLFHLSEWRLLKMKIAKTWFIICLLLVSMVIGIIPLTKAANQDSFGYTYTDSNTGGPAYSWIEINETGRKILPAQTDNNYVDNVPIGFSFGYYGAGYDQISVACSGALYFQGTQGYIAPYSDQHLFIWQPGDPASVYYRTSGVAPNRVFVVEWQNMAYCGNYTSYYMNGNGISFEAILYESTNNITFQYQDVNFDAIVPWLTGINNGETATVGIEAQSGVTGIQYSQDQPLISDGLSITFVCPAIISSSNLCVSINAPATMDRGNSMTYQISYCNFGQTQALDTTLNLTLPLGLDFSSASNGGTFDPVSRNITWNLGSINGAPTGFGMQTATVNIPLTFSTDIIQASAQIASSSPETTYGDNIAPSQTFIAGLNLPEQVRIDPQNGAIVGDAAGTVMIPNSQLITFQYNAPRSTANGPTSIDMVIHLDDGGSDISTTMNYVDFNCWWYNIAFGSRFGFGEVTFTLNYPTDDLIVTAKFEVVRVDPAGYIYDLNTRERVSGAYVWLQVPNERGGWVNAEIGLDPAIMNPDVNPQITGPSGRYQWDVLPGTYRVHIQAPGYYSADSIVVTVPPPVTDLHVGLVKIPLPQDNSPPIVHPISAPLYPIQVNAPVSFSSSFTDSNTLDTHSAVWSWSDGHTSKGIVTETNGEGTVMGTRIYTIAGVYTETVTLTVTDSNGGSSEISTQQYIVVYDPNAGFVTGGGWINSPAGAYLANPSLTGKANFGFVSKYAKGANVPTGNTEFDFKVANINFHSTSYDWLVVGGGSKAQYKGTGTINGADNYGFMLTAIDSQIKGHGASDTFRIKIWDKTTGNTIYDNQLGASENADPSTTIAGGNIIIHTK